ncbi:hypothetical protein DSM100238_0142 [Bifidobacterium apri]|uniref:Uncharacterized protein n=1 Tax=Bifidobacterium apri TaxID=1769423 RepID=A0A6A2VIW4_9BIFI|nr:hypothetical protein DSM100238_0142 [Bifidobacterium apri]
MPSVAMPRAQHPTMPSARVSHGTFAKGRRRRMRRCPSIVHVTAYATRQNAPVNQQARQNPTSCACPHIHNPAEHPTNHNTTRHPTTHVYPYIHNPAERSNQPQHHPTSNHPRIPAHTQPTKSSRLTEPPTSNHHAAYAQTYTTRQNTPTNQQTGQDPTSCASRDIHNPAKHPTSQRTGRDSAGCASRDICQSSPKMAPRCSPGIRRASLRGIPQVTRLIAVLHISTARRDARPHNSDRITPHHSAAQHSTTHIALRYIMARHATSRHITPHHCTTQLSASQQTALTPPTACAARQAIRNACSP